LVREKNAIAKTAKREAKNIFPKAFVICPKPLTKTPDNPPKTEKRATIKMNFLVGIFFSFFQYLLTKYAIKDPIIINPKMFPNEKIKYSQFIA